jgi:MFS family permease
VFGRLVAEKRIEWVPVVEAIKRQPKSIILTALARMGEQAPSYIYLTFVLAYGTQILYIPSDFLLTSRSVAGITSFVTIPLDGHLSDRIGRRRMYIIGAAATGIVGFIYFAMLNTTVPAWIFLGIVLSFIANDLMYGPQAALIAECFTPRLRYTGASIGYQLSSIISDGPAPLIATALFGLRDRAIHSLLRHRQHRRDRPVAGLHQSRHLRGARQTLIDPGSRYAHRARADRFLS